MLASLAGTRSASSDPFHLMRKKSSPGSLVAPIIFSGWSPRANPLGFSSVLLLAGERVVRNVTGVAVTSFSPLDSVLELGGAFRLELALAAAAVLVSRS